MLDWHTVVSAAVMTLGNLSDWLTLLQSVNQ